MFVSVFSVVVVDVVVVADVVGGGVKMEKTPHTDRPFVP